MLTLTSLGAAGTVTGSKHMLTREGHRVLIDCDLFHGLKNLRELNWEKKCPDIYRPQHQAFRTGDPAFPLKQY